MSDKPASDKKKNSGKARMLGHPKYWLSGEPKHGTPILITSWFQYIAGD